MKRLTLWDLLKKYPKIFSQSDSATNQYDNPKYQGLPIGWIDMVDFLCHGIQNYIDSSHADQVICTGMSQVHGRLHFKHLGGDRTTRILIKRLSHQCERTCETCGSNKDVRIVKRRHWISIICDKCKLNSPYTHKILKNE